MIFVEYIHTVSVCICLYPTLEGIYKFWNNDLSFNHIRTKSAVGTQRHSVSKSALRVVCIYGFMGEPFSTFMIFFPTRKHCLLKSFLLRRDRILDEFA